MSHQMIEIFPAPNEGVNDYTDRTHNKIHQTLSNNTLCIICNRVLVAPQHKLTLTSNIFITSVGNLVIPYHSK